MAGEILFQAPQEGIYEMTVVTSPFSLSRPYYWRLMQWPDLGTWCRHTSAHRTPMSGLAQPCRLLPYYTNESLTQELIWSWVATRFFSDSPHVFVLSLVTCWDTHWPRLPQESCTLCTHICWGCLRTRVEISFLFLHRPCSLRKCCSLSQIQKLNQVSELTSIMVNSTA